MPKKQTVFLIHFFPLESYPPVMNIIDYFAIDNEFKIVVVTNRAPASKALNNYSNSSEHVTIFRPAFQSPDSLLRYLNYFSFYISAFFLLLFYWPPVVMYFETLSSWPALVFKKIKKSLVLLVHYHEYTTPAEYQKRMWLSKWMHGIEIKMYPLFSRISQTNPVRLEKFKRDDNLTDANPPVLAVMPNYPSKFWSDGKRNRSGHEPVKKLVYVGSLGYKTMYLQEVLDWVGANPQLFTLDIYAHNTNAAAREALKLNQYTNIRFCGGSDYNALPQLLKDYDIGLVIHKPFSENTANAVSNKVFEYLACGLDVWFSKEMTYTFHYVRDDVYPKILPVDFNQLDQFDYHTAMNREGLVYKANEMFYEDVYSGLADHIRNSQTKVVQ